MSAAIVTAILNALLSVLAAAPALVNDVETAWALFTAGGATPTPQQMQQYADALDAAHKALQAS